MSRNKLGFYCCIMISLVLPLCGCGKFDRSKIKMPAFTFVTAENLHSIARIGQQLWISGSYGTILHSSDGGRKWVQQDSGVQDVLLGSIAFVDAQHGWAAGVAGTVVHTADGGAHWQAQQSGTGYDLLDLFFLDAAHGWAVGEYATIMHTADGGRIWQAQSSPSDTIYNDVFFLDRHSGWVVGEFGTILRTSDGGASWQRVVCSDLGSGFDESGWEQPLPALYGIFFADSAQGWIVGMDGIILHTSDGGGSWSKIPSGTDLPLYALSVSGSSGRAVGNKGVYLRSDDGGQTWRQAADAIKSKFWLRDVAFDGDRGLIVGARGTIAFSENGGQGWDLLSGFSYEMEEFGLADF